MLETWDDLKFWKSGEWQVIEERLDAYDQNGTSYNPPRSNLFHSMELCPYNTVRVAIVGQDPYPNPKFATGIAFSINGNLRTKPPTLEILYEELLSDLKIEPKNGNLEGWCKQGVLLWNCIPTCLAFKSGSHDWTEWTYLTKEIVERLSEKGIVFVFLGRKAQHYAQYVDEKNNVKLLYSHPSPLGSRASNHPFKGSRLFSTINSKLVEQGLQAIDWRL